VLLLAGLARATSLSGLGVPAPGGGWAGPAGEGVGSLVSTPAAAEGPGIFLDVGLLGSEYAYQLGGTETQRSSGWSPVPTLAASLPLGPVGLGLAIFAPYSRGGSGGDPDSPGRYHSGTSELTVIEGDLAAALHLRSWTLAAAGRVAHVGLTSTKATDTGALLYAMLGPEAGVPMGDPFLQGTQTVQGEDWVFGGAAAVRFRPERGPGFDLVFRSGLDATAEGTVQLRPSDDLSMVVDAKAAVHLPLPPELIASVGLPIGPVRIGADVGWEGWSSLNTLETTLSDARISSPDPLMESIFDSYGLTDEGFLDGLSSAKATTGLQDIVTGGLWGRFPTWPSGRGLAAVYYSPAAIPTDYVHPGNADFDALDLRAGLAHRAGAFDLALSLDYFLTPTRTVENSAFSLTADPSEGVTLPNANGTYSLAAMRLGLSLSWEPASEGTP
jgi:hypothetical protein